MRAEGSARLGPGLPEAIRAGIVATVKAASVKIEVAQRIARSRCSNFRCFGCMPWDW